MDQGDHAALIPLDADPRLLLPLGNTGRHRDGEIHAPAPDGEFHGSTLGGVQDLGQRGLAQKRPAIGGHDEIPAAQPRLLGRAVGENPSHHRGDGGYDLDLAKILPAPPVARLDARLHLDDLLPPVALEADGNHRGGTHRDIPGHTVAHAPHPVDPLHRMAVHGDDPVSGLKPSPRGRTSGNHIADLIRGLGLADRATYEPDNTGEEKGKAEAGGRTGSGHDDLVKGTGGRKIHPLLISLSLDRLHRGKLGNGHEPSGRNASQAVLHASHGLRPEGLAEPDGELLHLQAPPLRGEEVTQFMDHDEEVEEQHHLENDADDFEGT